MLLNNTCYNRLYAILGVYGCILHVYKQVATNLNKMKLLKRLIGIIIVLTFLCCSSDDNSNSEKKLIQITNKDPGGYVYFNQNYVYDSNERIIQINDENGLILNSYTYNSSNLPIQNIDYHYNYDDGIRWLKIEIMKNITYNSDNKISAIKILYKDYNMDASLNLQYDYTINVTYGPNSMTSIRYNEYGIFKVEYELSNNSITGIKITNVNTVEADMVFAYDTEGNCISGNGPNKMEYHRPDDIDLTVTYGTEEKNPIFNAFFDINILFIYTFRSIRETLIHEQGTKFPERIQWYNIPDDSNKDAFEYTFDHDDYLIKKVKNMYSPYGHRILTYKWE